MIPGLGYWARSLRLAARDPLRVPSLFRLKHLGSDEWRDPMKDAAVTLPKVISIRMNYACNLRCVMCNQWGENGTFIQTPERMVRREMSLDDWKMFIDRVARFRPYIYFTGGEPLMNPDALELVRHCARRHLVTGMSTNGTYLKAQAEPLIRSGLDYLYTSLDSPVPLENGSIRPTARGGDSSADAVDAIGHVIRLRDKMGVGLPMVQVQTIVVRENHDRLFETARFVDDVLKADCWGLQLCVFTTPELDRATTRTYQERYGQDQTGWTGFIRGFEGLDPGVLESELDRIRRHPWRFKLRLYRPMGMRGFSFERYFFEPGRFAVDEPLTCMNPYVFAQI
ncbi:MAG: radical SAM protein, partial [Candidatus Omnitrophica bacterium]|nr:radical SAM protein [Candidatus Omnitrophota bacterium]